MFYPEKQPYEKLEAEKQMDDNKSGAKMGNDQKLKDQSKKTSGEEPNRVSRDAASILLFRLREQYEFEVLKNSSSNSNKNRYFYAPFNFKKKTESFRNQPAQANREPQSLDSVFHKIIRLRGWNPPLAVGAVTARWAELIGENNAKHSQIESFVNSKIVVRCDSTVWANSLKTMKKNIIEMFDREVGQNVVTEVEILGPKGIPNWNKGPWSAPGRGPRDTYG